MIAFDLLLLTGRHWWNCEVPPQCRHAIHHPGLWPLLLARYDHVFLPPFPPSPPFGSFFVESGGSLSTFSDFLRGDWHLWDSFLSFRPGLASFTWNLLELGRHSSRRRGIAEHGELCLAVFFLCCRASYVTCLSVSEPPNGFGVGPDLRASSCRVFPSSP